MNFRHKVLTVDVAEHVRAPMRKEYVQLDIQIVKRVVVKDQLVISVSAPLNMVPSEIMRRIKSNNSSRLFEEFPHLKKRYGIRYFRG